MDENTHNLTIGFEPFKKNWFINKYNDLIGYRLRHFRTSVKNLIRWFPVIWKDRDWDDHYIFEILKTKLKFQAKYIGERDIHTRAKYDAQRMMLCVRLIQKIQDEYYACEYMDYHESRFDWLEIEGDPEHKQLHIEEISENYDEFFAKYKSATQRVLNNKENQTSEITDKNDKRFLAMNLAHYNQKRAQDLLFKLLSRDIRGWWD